MKFKPFIIDFGKACRADCGKRYKLTAEQKDLYKKEHSQVAPDLRDGLVSQSFLTDHLFFWSNCQAYMNYIIESSSLRSFCRQIMSYHSCERPSLESILQVLGPS